MDEKRDFMEKLSHFWQNVEIPLLLVHRSKYRLHNGRNFMVPKTPKSTALPMIATLFFPSSFIFPQNPRPIPYCLAGLSKALAAGLYWQIHPCR